MQQKGGGGIPSTDRDHLENNHMSVARLTIPSAIVTAVIIGHAGCGSLEQVDRHVEALLAETSEEMNAGVVPRVRSYPDEPGRVASDADPYREQLPTRNPSAESIPYVPAPADDDPAARLEEYSQKPPDVVAFDLGDAFAYAVRNSRDFRNAEEQYVLTSLRLLIERHLWGPRFFNDTTATIAGTGDDGFFDTSLRLVNEFSVTQRLPYGGTVSATALARATEDLHSRVSGGDVQDAEILLAADIPLLRGAGLSAREGRIQAERDLIYAARRFERFRRQFLVDIASAFLGLVADQQAIERRERALARAGRTPPFEAARAAQDTLDARSSLNNQREFFRLSVDRFKVRIGMPTTQPLEIVESTLELEPPAITMTEAVRTGLAYRLDLQTARDEVDDSQRRVDNAFNDLLPDLDFTGSVSLNTDASKDRAGLDFDLGETDFVAGITFGLPLDREIERVRIRQQQIALERSRRDFDEFRDNVLIDVRGALREIDRARFNLELQDEDIRIAELRQASIDAAPDRADARERSEAIDEFLRAQDARDLALRDLQIAILEYLLSTGQLRVERDGSLMPLGQPGDDNGDGGNGGEGDPAF
jgi:outer membrane protein TolC